ncbi:cupin domain-containing protein [Prosthecobacter sp.]|uniref:cupin domain-containing protein n=1 Tax=Prosthecobacter sp. TaxID=1965333 RepID=UPI0037849266
MNIANIRGSDEDFHLLVTTGRSQSATMRLAPGDATSEEPNTHPHSDQVVLLLEGEVVAEIGGERATLRENQCVTVPAGVEHRFINQGTSPAFAFTVYGPPAYPTDDPT